MKFVRIFGLLTLLHVAVWGVTHFYLQANRNVALVVVDTSFAMKEHFRKVADWIDDYEGTSRYQDIIVGTDKALLGDIEELSSKEIIFRTAFGKLTSDNLKRHYSDVKADKKLLLTNSTIDTPGWEKITF